MARFGIVRHSLTLSGLIHSYLVVAAVAAATVTAQTGGTVLTQIQLEKMIPATVYYDGQSAATQLRNSGGVKFADGHYMLASLVDTGGYSTGIAAKYQGYLIAEVPLKIGGKQLRAGAYGFGFLGDASFLVTDLGGGDVISVRAEMDESMQRPRPLQVVAASSGGFRLYAGRRYVHFDR